MSKTDFKTIDDTSAPFRKVCKFPLDEPPPLGLVNDMAKFRAEENEVKAKKKTISETMSNHHKINYIEFPAENLPEIKKFYSEAFGWKFTDYGPEYTAFNDGQLDGGFTSGTVAKDSGALVILYSEYLEDSVEIIVQCGGEITKPIYDFPGGRRFHFVDPAGNELAVWSDK